MDAASLLNRLEEERGRFLAFLTTRLGNATDAEDLLQHAFVKALRHAEELREDTRLNAWFYRILRHAIIDHVRSRRAAADRDEEWARQVFADPESEARICACLNGVIATLRPAHAELIRRVGLDGEPVAAAATALGMTAGNASVLLHRARGELRRRLEVTCGECSESACRNCDCNL